jgi:hypothetical protein
MNVPKLGLSVLAGFVLVVLLGALLHAVDQDSGVWWCVLLPIWLVGAWLLYMHWPWKWPPNPPPVVR